MSEGLQALRPYSEAILYQKYGFLIRPILCNSLNSLNFYCMLQDQKLSMSSRYKFRE